MGDVCIMGDVLYVSYLRSLYKFISTNECKERVGVVGGGACGVCRHENPENLSRTRKL